MLHPPRQASRAASLDAPVTPGDGARSATPNAEPPSQMPIPPGPAAGARPVAPLPSIWWVRAPLGVALGLSLPIVVTFVLRALGPEIAPATTGLFLFAAALAAAVGGVGAGLLATALALPLAAYWV